MPEAKSNRFTKYFPLLLDALRSADPNPMRPAEAIAWIRAKEDVRAQAEIQLELLPRLTFQAPDPLGMHLSKLAHKALYGLIGIGESGFLHQILVNALGT